MSVKRKALMSRSKVESVEEEDDYDVAPPPSPALLDLPELALDCILERLSPESLCKMAGVSVAMRERCVADRLWECHVARKWGSLLGRAARREWLCHVASRVQDHHHHHNHVNTNNNNNNKQQHHINNNNNSNNGGLLLKILSLGWPFSNNNTKKQLVMRLRTVLPLDSLMAFFLSLQSGKFCFPAQVYNRENGHVGFMLSCYDAQVSYDSKTDTFQARYPPHGRRAMAVESGVAWERLRAPPIDTPPHILHVSDCLNQLTPGDHIEIQWRRNKDFPYGWWYGVVGHLESCDGNENHCRCHYSDTVVLEFNQYTPGSRWRHTTVNRKDHREEGNEADGFYGGIRKLTDHHEITTWKHLWPAETLD